MLLRLFASRPPNPSSTGVVVGEKPLVLQIVHPGGVIERYYMAFPAAFLMDKYPNFVLARPEIFRQPWDAIVKAEEILVPGQKYLVVPIRTVKKLRRQIWKPRIEASNALISQDDDTASTKSLSLGKPKPCIRRVRFKGIESKARNDSGAAQGNRKKSSNGTRPRTKSVRFAPSLTMIDETQGFED